MSSYTREDTISLSWNLLKIIVLSWPESILVNPFHGINTGHKCYMAKWLPRQIFSCFMLLLIITKVIEDINIVKYWYIILQHSLNMSSPSNKSSSDTSSHHNHVESSSCHTQGRPRAGSESSSGRGAVSKVMDMFRHRSHSAVSAEDKRKAVSRLVYFTNS
jgi:hypothetical protein